MVFYFPWISFGAQFDSGCFFILRCILNDFFWYFLIQFDSIWFNMIQYDSMWLLIWFTMISSHAISFHTLPLWFYSLQSHLIACDLIWFTLILFDFQWFSLCSTWTCHCQRWIRRISKADCGGAGDALFSLWLWNYHLNALNSVCNKPYLFNAPCFDFSATAHQKFPNKPSLWTVRFSLKS